MVLWLHEAHTNGDKSLSRSLFHTFHTATDYKITCNDVSIKKIQQTYKGYILNSNWADDCKIYELGQRLPLTFHLRELFRK